MAVELRKCPFCGADPRVVVEHPKLRTGKRDTLFKVECTLRECGVSTLQWYPKAAAVRSWNRRVCYSGGKRVKCGLLV